MRTLTDRTIELESGIQIFTRHAVNMKNTLTRSISGRGRVCHILNPLVRDSKAGISRASVPKASGKQS